MTINELTALRGVLQGKIDETLPANRSHAMLACYRREIALVNAHIATLKPQDGDRATTSWVSTNWLCESAVRNWITMSTIPTSELVAWCPSCKWHLPADAIGDTCPGDECYRKLLKRRGWICTTCEMQDVYFSKADYLNHGGHE